MLTFDFVAFSKAKWKSRFPLEKPCVHYDWLIPPASIFEARRLHKLGHRNVTIPLKTRWFTPAGFCVSTRKIEFLSRVGFRDQRS